MSGSITRSFIKKRLIDLEALREVRKFRFKEWDIILCDLPRASFFARISLKDSAPIITTYHGPAYLQPHIWLMERLFHHRDRASIAISNAVKLYVVKNLGVPAKKIKVVYNGLEVGDLDKIPPNPHHLQNGLSLPPSTPIFTMVGHFYIEKRKRHELFLESARKLLEKERNVHFAIVGWHSGTGKSLSYMESIMEYAHKLGLGENVHFLGRRSDIANILDSSICLVHPSILEGFGMVLLEAMARRKPVIGVRHWAIPEVVKDGETGIIVEPDNPELLAEAMLKILHSPQMAREMGEKGRERLERYFTARKMGEEYWKFFRSLKPEASSQARSPHSEASSQEPEPRSRARSRKPEAREPESGAREEGDK
jgi:glycosyltransferase involved in cell wall biosynthesis